LYSIANSVRVKKARNWRKMVYGGKQELYKQFVENPLRKTCSLYGRIILKSTFISEFT
jgi:hypothetical protein